jgi:hypothetical protein
MPASFPGSTLAQNKANPSLGAFVNFCPLSGPKGSPLDVRKLSYSGNVPTYTNDAANQQPSTGGLSTGIGIGDPDIINIWAGLSPATAPQAIFRAGFNDNDIPGQVPTYSAGGPPPVVASSAINSTRMYIGGGRVVASAAKLGVPFTPSPYTAGVAICGGGNGGSRDGGAGPAFTGFPMKMVTAVATVANGAVIETGWVNRSGKTVVATQSCFGSATAVLAAPS